MKKIISLQALMLMGLAIGSTSLVEAYGNKNKYAHDKQEGKSACEKDKMSEDSLKKEYGSIRRNFDKTHDVVAARAKLKVVDKKAKQFNKTIEKDEEHKNVASMHEHSLQRVSRHLHEHIDKYARAHSSKE